MSIKIIDAEWDNAENSNEDAKYYMCYRDYGFGGIGKWVKKYKPTLAKIVLKRGIYDKMVQLN